MNCECGKELQGKQTKFCCRKCQNRNINNRNNTYKLQQIRGLKRKLNFIIQMGGKCEKCGYNKNLAALNFHHNDPNFKELKLDIRSMSNNSLEILMEEIKKCKLLCSNCHHELHHPKFDLNLVAVAGLEPTTSPL